MTPANRSSTSCVLALPLALTLLAACGEGVVRPEPELGEETADLDVALDAMLASRSFTGRIAERLEARLGRPIDQRLAAVGHLLFFDPILSLTGDNSCSGCHGPNVGFNDSKAIAIGVGNNGVVGPARVGPHNLRRAPSVINAPFYPKLMWDSRFEALSLDPFDNSGGFAFPEPEGRTLSGLEHLLVAQAFTPVVSRQEMAGFDFLGDNDAMRTEVAARVDAIDGYRILFSEVFANVAAGNAVEYVHIARALAEFQFTLIRANAPIDRFARGDFGALTDRQKRGGILFFGEAMCGECHIVRGYANEMFSDFETHVLAVPQIAPLSTNSLFDGPGADEDFGVERESGDEEDRYEFRTSPLRNVAFQPSLMHNGAYECVSDAIRHHMRILESLQSYSPQHLSPSLQGPRGPIAPVLDRLHELIREPPRLSDQELAEITDFVEIALADPEAHPDRLASLIPTAVPSGLPVHSFDFGGARPDCS